MTNEAQLVRENPFALKTRDNSEVSMRDPSMMDAVVSRQAQEVQAAMVIAKKYPRDEVRAWERIMRACQRPALAEGATYSYPKGGANVSGPSIRLAECIAQNWGNIDFGIIELHQQDGKSEMMAYAWDLETNTRQTKIFTVNHMIEKKGGQVKILTDPRDIYEITANQGARRLRACILGVIPSDVVEDAVGKCDDTLSKADGDVPIIDRVKKMVTVFDGVGVTPAMIEKRFSKKLDKLGEQELVLLRKIYTSIRDGFSKAGDQFEPAAERASDLQQPAHQQQAPAPKSAPKQPAPAQPAVSVAKVEMQPPDDIPMSFPEQNVPHGTIPAETTDVPADPATGPQPTPQTPPAPPQPPVAASAKKEVAPKRAKKEEAAISDVETLKALMTTDNFKEAEVIALCVRKFKGAAVQSVSEWDAGYIQDVLTNWAIVGAQLRMDRNLA